MSACSPSERRLSVQPVASARSERGSVCVGRDACDWPTAADRSGRVGGTFRGGVNAVFGFEALVCLQSPSVPIHPWALVAKLPWQELGGLFSVRMPNSSRSTARQTPARWAEGHDERLHVKI